MRREAPHVLMTLATFFVLTWMSAATAEPGLPRLAPHEVETAILAAFPDVRAAVAAVEAAEGELRAARLLPDISLELGATRNTARVGMQSRVDPVGGVEWQLPLPWRYRAGTRLALHGVLAARAEADLVLVELRARVRALMTELAAAQERLAILDVQRSFTADLAGLIALRVEAGESREFDRLRAVVELARIDREVELVRAEAEAFSATLSRLAAGALPETFELADTLPGAVPFIDPAAVVEAALQRYPALRLARQQVLLAEAGKAVATAERSPALVTRATRGVELDSTAAELSLGLRLPLWNANRGQIATAQARVHQAEAGFEGARREVAVRATAAARRYLAARAAEQRAVGELLPAARESRDLAEFSYRQGEVSLLEALDARRAYQEAALDDLDMRRILHLLRVELEALTGEDLAVLAAATPTNGSDTDE